MRLRGRLHKLASSGFHAADLASRFCGFGGAVITESVNLMCAVLNVMIVGSLWSYPNQFLNVCCSGYRIFMQM